MTAPMRRMPLQSIAAPDPRPADASNGMLRRTTAGLLAALALCLATAPRAETPLRVEAVTLSTAGLAMIEARATLGAAPLRLTIPRHRIDDFLKSLWLIDPQQAPARLSMDGPARLDDLFRDLPLTPEEIGDRTRLLGALRGAPIMVTRAARQWQGINMGVSPAQCGADSCTMLNLMEDGGNLRQFRLDEGLEIRLTDPAQRAMVQQSLAALHGADGARVALEIDSDDASEREIGLIWLQEAPLWRTAWRAVDGPEGLRLSGWAIVENATGRDWHDVRLTLATGAVRAIRAPLYERLYAQREAPATVVEPGIVVPQARALHGLAQMDMAEAVAPLAVETDDGESFTRFTLAAPVSLPAGQMLMVPFLEESLTEARLTLFRGGTGSRHPEIALEIENPLPLRLPAGVLTLYEAGRGHAGDAMIPELAPGARQLVPFARDTAMSVREEVASTEHLREMRLVAGVLEVTEDIERRTRYRIEGAPQADRILTIEHPRRDGWTVTAPAGWEERLDHWRWQVAVPAGAHVSLDVRERQPRQRRVAVMDIDLPTLAAWQGRAEDPALRARLSEIAALRGRIVAAERAVERLRARAADLREEQDRLVGLIVQLGEASAATPERRDRVDAIDAEIAAAREEMQALGDEAAQARARIDTLLGGQWPDE